MQVNVLPELSGRRVQWNSTDEAEIVSAWVVMEPRKAGVTTVGHDAKTFALFRLSDGRLVEDSLWMKVLLPKS